MDSFDWNRSKEDLLTEMRIVFSDIFDGTDYSIVRNPTQGEKMNNIYRRGSNKRSAFVIPLQRRKSFTFAFNTEYLPAIKMSGVNVTVPEGYQVIDRRAFFDNDTIEYVKLPSTLVKIGAAAFSRCSSLRSVDIQQGLETIEYGAFSHCDRLKSLVLPDTLTTIEENAFDGSTRNLVVRCSEDNSYIRHYCRMNRVKTEHIE